MSKPYLNSYTQAPKTHFTQIANALIRTPTLSCKAFKLLCIGLSHSSWWEFNKRQIATCFKEGDYTLDVAMKELRGLGYLHLVARRRDDGRMVGHNWFWFHEPMSDENFKKFHRNLENPEFGDNRSSEDIGDIRRPEEKKTIPYKEPPPPSSSMSPRGSVVGREREEEEEAKGKEEVIPSWIARAMELPKAQRVVAEAIKANVTLTDELKQAFEEGLANDTIDNPYSWLLSFAQGRSKLRQATQGTQDACYGHTSRLNSLVEEILIKWSDCISENAHKDARLAHISKTLSEDRAARRLMIPEGDTIVPIELHSLESIQKEWPRIDRAIKFVKALPVK